MKYRNMNEKMRVNLSELLPVIEEQLSLGKEVCFSPNGISMLPMLRAGRDSVFLKSPPPKLKKYDLPLYRRRDGKFVLHRVVKVQKNGCYTMCGDNQYSYEPDISHEQIIGIVSVFVRKNKRISCNNATYRLYCMIRVRERRLYGVWLRLTEKLVNLKNKLKK